MKQGAGIRAWSREEELANAISHGLGFAAAAAGAPFLLEAARKAGGEWSVVTAWVFAVAAMLLYLSSALHHGLPIGRGKDVLEVVDHSAIFLLIAGTYTPFSLGVLQGTWGWTLLTVVWTLALAGIGLKLCCGVRYPVLTIWLYVGMGWLMLVAAQPLYLRLPAPGLWLILCGGLAYTGGLAFYLSRGIRFHHLLWHMSVIVGTACHYFAILWYVY